MRPRIRAKSFLRMNWLLLAAVLVAQADATEPSGQASVHITYTDSLVQLSDQPWQYHSGDNIEWARPDWDDSNWEQADTYRSRRYLGDEITSPVGWYRRSLEVDSSAVGKNMALIFFQIGASEVYLDGRLIYQFGTVGADPDTEELQLRTSPVPEPIVFAKPGRHVLAVRHSANSRDFTDAWGDLRGFAVGINRYDAAQDYSRGWLSFQQAHQHSFTAFALAFGLLHFLMWYFHRPARENLHYALLAINLAGITYFAIQVSFTTELASVALIFLMFKLSVIGTSIFAPLVIYGFFYDKIPGRFKYGAALGVLLAGVSWWLPMAAVFIFALLSLAESFRVVLLAVFRRHRMSWFVGLGFGAFIITCTLQILPSIFPSLQSQSPFSGMYLYYLWGILALLISMTIYLAKDFARINRDLRNRLIEVQELSRKTVEQQRLAQQQEMDRKLLEADLAKQKIELQKAAELRKAHVELSAANKNLRETQAQLVQSEKMASLGTLVAGIAHELNTPIGAVYSMHQTLMKAVENVQSVAQTATQESLEDRTRLEKSIAVIDDANRVIRSGAERVTEIVKRLRSFARLDEAEKKSVDIHEGIEDTIQLIQHEVKHQIEIIRDFGELPKVVCYPGKLNQVFLNVLNNARQAISGPGTVTVSTRCAGDRVEIRISDTGSGIPKKHLERIFDPGFTTRGVGVGTGLGLSICYQIVREHNGVIRAESTEGQGATIIIDLPVHADKGSDR